MTILLLAFASNDAHADCPAAPIADPDDMVVSFLALNGTQAAPGTLIPSTVKEGMLVYDDTAGKLKICDGTNWVDVGSGSGTDTLASLSCASGEIAKYNGSAWACAADGGGSGSSGGTKGLYFSGSINIGTTATVLDVASTRNDFGAGWTSGVFTVPAGEAGWYIMSAFPAMTAAVGESLSVSARINGAVVATSQGGTPTGAAYGNQTAVSHAAFLNAGDTVSFVSQKSVAATGTTVRGSVVKVSGGSGISPAFYVHKNGTAQTVTTSTWVKLTGWNDTVAPGFDSNANFASDRFTPTVAGKYIVTASAYCTGTSTNSGAGIYKNGTMIAQNYVAVGAGGIPTATTVVDMNGGSDYVEAHVNCGGGTSVNGTVSGTSFSGALVGGGGGSSQWTTIGNDLHYGTGGVAIGQVSAPDASAALELESTTKGFLPSRMTTVQRDAIASPATGLMIFNTTTAQYQFWNGSAWSGLGGSGSVPTGTIAAFELTTCPTGWTEYTASRGRFLRGIDNGAGNDPSGTRVPGNVQSDDIKSHLHSVNPPATATNSAGAHSHDYNKPNITASYRNNLEGGSNGNQTVTAGSATSSDGAHAHTVDVAAFNSDATGIAETRPKNVAVLFCQYSGSGGGGGATTLAELTDVDVSALANGKVLTYNSTTSKWEAVTPSGGGTPAPSNGYVQFNSSGAFGGDANLFWDNTNKRLGIGTAAPKGRLDVFGPTVSNATNFYFGGSDQTLGNETRLYLSPVAVSNQQKIAIISEASNAWGRGKLHLALNPANDNSDATKVNAVMTLLDSGNVGVGTTSPAAKLHVIGGALLDEQAGDGSAIKITERGTGFGAKLVWLDENQTASAAVTKTANDSLGFYTNGAQSSGQEKLVITADGNVGIGTTAPTLEGTFPTPRILQILTNTANGTSAIKLGGPSPGDGNGLIEVGAAGYLSGDHWSWNPTFGTNLAAKYDGSASVYFTPRTFNSRGYGGLSYDYNGSAHFFGAVSNTTAGQTITPVERMTILSSNGNVGIGTTTPSSRLTVHSSGTQDNNLAIEFVDNEQPASLSTLAAGFGGAFSANMSGGQAEVDLINRGSNTAPGIQGFRFVQQTGTGTFNYLMTIDGDSGNVGIGETNPPEVLSIEGTNPAIFLMEGATAGIKFKYDDAANSLGIIGRAASVDTTLMTITRDSGNVGIGTATPSAKTDIYGTGQLTAALTDAGNRGAFLALNANAAGTDNGGAITFGNSQSLAAGSLGFAAIKGLLANGAGNTVGAIAFSNRNSTSDTALTERMRISYNGNVGIGTNSPGGRLHVYPEISQDLIIDGWSAANTDIDGLLPGSATGSLITGPTNAHMTFALRDNDGGDGFYFLTTNASYGTDNAYDTMALAIKSNGNVGIGTTTPGARFSIKDAAGTGHINMGQLSGNSVFGALGFSQTSAALTAANYSMTGEGSNTLINRPAGGIIEFRESNVGQMTIAAGGNVGIGTASPGQKLTVAGTIESTSGGVKFPDGSTQTTSAGIPAGAVMAFDLTTCPAGWVEYTAARGRFLRGIDNGAGNDPDGTRAPGNAQLDELKNHTHNYVQSLNNNGDYGSTNQEAANKGVVAGVTDATGGAETRPKNVAVLFCRKN